MLFNSFEFALFFPAVLLAHFGLPGRFRWLLLLLASCAFYMAFVPAYILILALTIVVDYVAGLLIARAQGVARKAWLGFSLLANIGVLAVFKYWPFLYANAQAAAGYWGFQNPVPALSMILPIGLSFHTFQAMSYTIEVYRGAQEPERHFGRYALYVMYFPQLVAGPIERPQNLLPQLAALDNIGFSSERMTSGLRLIAWGLLKKAIVADRLAVLVDRTYADLAHADSVALLVSAYAFSVQIYCDFSAYSDIARGASRILGVELMRNFERPYESASLGEFWRRWHISLSTWFRDYVYVPLGGSRGSRARTIRNLLIVFLLSGLWHGANWTFVVWGAIHGVAVAVSSGSRQPRAARLGWRTLAVFHLVTLAWVFFRAPSLADATTYLVRLFSAGGWLTRSTHNLGEPSEVVLAGVAAYAVLVLEHLAARHSLVDKLLAARRSVRWAVYYSAVLAFLLLARVSHQQFIYFQF